MESNGVLLNSIKITLRYKPQYIVAPIQQRGTWFPSFLGTQDEDKCSLSPSFEFQLVETLNQAEIK